MASDKLPSWLQAARAHWQYRGVLRPPFAQIPGPGQESVWDYPRPPALTLEPGHITIALGETIIADTRAALKLAETASAPTFYLPQVDINLDCLVPAGEGSFCEWKGSASYFDIVVKDQIRKAAAWCYERPLPGYERLAHHVAFYPCWLECHLDLEKVRAQPGGLYGGWVTDRLAGPVKGEPGTEWW